MKLESTKRIEEILSKYIDNLSSINNNSPKLIVVLGVLGDLDSFEYVQTLLSSIDLLKTYNIKLKIIGIGNSKGKELFCKFTKIEPDCIELVHTDELHQSLNLNNGLSITKYKLLNLILMCTGFKSPGTLKEVLRGYTGDPFRRAIFQQEEEIRICDHISFKGKFFNLAGPKSQLRPFELATRRLLNMKEVLTNWSSYMPYSNYFTSRGGTFLFKNDQLVYCYRPSSLLLSIPNPRNPLEFLNSLDISEISVSQNELEI